MNKRSDIKEKLAGFQHNCITLENEYAGFSAITRGLFAATLVLWALLIVVFGYYRHKDSESTVALESADRIGQQTLKFQAYNHLLGRLLISGPALAASLKNPQQTDKAPPVDKVGNLKYGTDLEASGLEDRADYLKTFRLSDSIRAEFSEYSWLLEWLESLHSRIEAHKAGYRNGEIAPSPELDQDLASAIDETVLYMRNYLALANYDRVHYDESKSDDNAKIFEEIRELSSLLAGLHTNTENKEEWSNRVDQKFHEKFKALTESLRDKKGMPLVWSPTYPGGIDAWASIQAELDTVERDIQATRSSLNSQLRTRILSLCIAILISLFFLLSIKVTLDLYRYSSKMEAFYFGRHYLFDFLQECRGPEGQYQLSDKEIFELLRPEQINFGKSNSAYPTKKALQILQSASSYLKK